MAVLYTPHFVYFTDDNGEPLAGGKLYTYAAGTTTPKATFTTAAGTVENTNPVILDAYGRAVLFIEGSYKFTLTDSSDNVIRTTDNVSSFTTTGDANDAFFQTFSGNGTQTVFTLSEDLGTDEKLLMVFVDNSNRDYAVNGDFATDTDWTKGSGWSIGSGVATATSASSDLEQTAGFTIEEGVSYTITYTITRSAGTVTPKIGGTSGESRSSSGTYVETIIAGSTQVIAFEGSGFSGTVDNVDVKVSNGKGFEIQSTANYTVNGTSLTIASSPASGTNNIQVWSPARLAAAASASAAAAATSEANAATSETLSQEWATKTDGIVDSTDYASKAWSIGGTGVTNTASRGAAKEWAITTGGTVDTNEYSAKAYAQDDLTGAAGGSAKDWAITAEDSVVAGGEYSAKHYAAKAENSAQQYIGTSTTSLTIGTGSKVFTTQENKNFDVGVWVLAVSDADETNYMHGQVTAYSGTSLTVNVTNIGGSGTLADWTITVSGTRGAQGPTGTVGSVTNIDAATSAGGFLRNLGDQNCASWGGGGGQNFSVTNTLSFGAGGASVTGVLDEDDMASDSAVKLATQQSIKAYVDNNAGGGLPNGGYANNRYYAGVFEYASSMTTTANTLYCLPFPPAEDVTFNRVYLEANAASISGNFRLGLYEMADGVPTNLIADYGVISLSSQIGVFEITISQALSAGTCYGLAMVTDSAVSITGGIMPDWGEAYFIGQAAAGSPRGYYTVSHTYGALPDPFGTPTLGSGTAPALGFRKV